MLESNLDKVVAGRTGVRFFFPLCGKAVDMKWYENVALASSAALRIKPFPPSDDHSSLL